MKINSIAIEKLIPYHNNPRKDQAVDKVASSINEYGFQQPIVVDKNMVVVVGHTRLMGAKKLGLKRVPTVIADLTETQAKAYRIADNRINEDSTWDMELLNLEIAGLSEVDFDLDLLGFDSSELDKFLVNDEEYLTDEDEVPEISEKTISKVGDIWQLGKHKLIIEDCTKVENIQKLCGDQKVDLYLTDPPYNVSYEGKTKDKLTIQNDKQADDDFILFLSKAFLSADNFLKMGGSFYIWHSDSEGLNFRLACLEAKWKLRQTLIWSKNSMVMGRQDYQWQHEPCLYGWKEGSSHNWYSDRKQTTIINHDRPTQSKLHPTMKPVSLLEYLIKNSSKQEDIILDSFLGSGSTLIACEKLSRICYGAELDPRYADVIIKRWEDFTGKKAKKIC